MFQDINPDPGYEDLLAPLGLMEVQESLRARREELRHHIRELRWAIHTDPTNLEDYEALAYAYLGMCLSFNNPSEKRHVYLPAELGTEEDLTGDSFEDWACDEAEEYVASALRTLNLGLRYFDWQRFCRSDYARVHELAHKLEFANPREVARIAAHPSLWYMD